MRAFDNPFATERIHQVRYRPRGWTWDELLSRAERMHYRGAIVGPEGSGKTTLMQDLAERLRGRGFNPIFIGLTRQRRSFASGYLSEVFRKCGPSEILCFDGCEQMSLPAWCLFKARCRRVGGLLVTVHKPSRLPTLVECDTDAPLLRRIIETLLPDDPVGEKLCAELHDRHQGNIRNALRELYDHYADIGPK